MVDKIGYNVNLEFLQAQNKAFEFTEGKTLDLIATLNMLNDQNRDLQKLSNALTHAKKNKKDAEFLRDEEMRATIERIHEMDPRLFGAVGETLRAEDFRFKLDDIETTLSLIDGKIKDQSTKINETTMYINQNYQDRIQFTETAQKTQDMNIRHIDSIIGKTGRGG